MTRVDYPEPIRQLILQLKRLPGIGPKSAERLALWLLRGPALSAGQLAAALATAAQSVATCVDCGFFSSRGEACSLCGNPARDHALLCVVEQATDILPLERTGAYHGLYHALGGKLSPLENIGPENLRVEELFTRIRRTGVQEVVLAVGSDVEGEATAHYLADALRAMGVTVSRLAQGLPAGGGLESADQLTLFRALNGRQKL
ncbi:MAG: recombination protein RecR [Verrucomicrobiales bacterium]|nr:recombination protein RecR [Verrucomicrobiales bacterium]